MEYCNGKVVSTSEVLGSAKARICENKSLLTMNREEFEEYLEIVSGRKSRKNSNEEPLNEE